MTQRGKLKALLVGALVVLSVGAAIRFQKPVLMRVYERKLARETEPDEYAGAAERLRELDPKEGFLARADRAAFLKYHLIQGFGRQDLLDRREATLGPRLEDETAEIKRQETVERELRAKLREIARAEPDVLRAAIERASDAAVRRNACVLAGLAADRSLVPALLQAIGDAEREVQKAAYRAASGLATDGEETRKLWRLGLLHAGSRGYALHDLGTAAAGASPPAADGHLLLALVDTVEKGSESQRQAALGLLRRLAGAPVPDPGDTAEAWRAWLAAQGTTDRGPR